MSLWLGILIGAGSVLLLDVVLFGCLVCWLAKPWEPYPTKRKSIDYDKVPDPMDSWKGLNGKKW